MREMPCVFISYAHKDRRFVEETLTPLLDREGIQCWYSDRDILPPHPFDAIIRDNLDLCDWFLVVLSSNSVESEWVKSEVAWAVVNRQGRIIVVRIDESFADRLHLMLARIQYVDFIKPTERHIRKLLDVWKPAIVDQEGILLQASKKRRRRTIIVLCIGIVACLLTFIAYLVKPTDHGLPQKIDHSPDLPNIGRLDFDKPDTKVSDTHSGSPKPSLITTTPRLTDQFRIGRSVETRVSVQAWKDRDSTFRYPGIDSIDKGVKGFVREIDQDLEKALVEFSGNFAGVIAWIDCVNLKTLPE
jgi:hypothetical protein